MNPDPDDDARLVERLLDEVRDRPADVIPRKGPTREVIEQLRAGHMQGVVVTWPGEPILDVDGIPVGMTEPQTFEATLIATVISEREGEVLGLPQTDDD